MPVAKTYESLEMQGEPFKENGRMYVNVMTSKGLKKVRWYSDNEYQRMYPNAIKEEISTFNARYAFGFREEGFITLYKGDESIIEDWARDKWPPKAWYNLFFHFFTPGFMPIENVPEGITPIRLDWNEIAAEGNSMKSHQEVQRIVAEKLGTLSTSEYQGNENDWLEKEITVRENKTHETQYGDKHTFFMVDAEGNTYVWETGAKNYESGATVKLKMKVKAHKEINGEKCTIVWYCKEI